jgi:hypothetical protein
MENRVIQIANTKTQRRYAINTSATTLGELQDEMTAQGIDFTGMTFTEGISKTQLLNRESLLPTNVMYKGQPTNNLVMLLTNTTKQISSGAMDRKEAYRLIKEMNLQDVIAEGEGQNYTRCKTDVLEEYINDNNGFDANETSEITEEAPETIEEQEKPEPIIPNVKTAPHADLVELVYLGVKYLTRTHNMVADDVAVIADLTTDLYKRLKESQPKISDADIDDMIAGI